MSFSRFTRRRFLTRTALAGAKLPIAFDSDREAIAAMLASLPLPDPRAARVIRIADTLSLAEMEISEPLWNEVRARPELTALSEPREMTFDPEGNLPES